MFAARLGTYGLVGLREHLWWCEIDYKRGVSGSAVGKLLSKGRMRSSSVRYWECCRWAVCPALLPLLNFSLPWGKSMKAGNSACWVLERVQGGSRELPLEAVGAVLLAQLLAGRSEGSSIEQWDPKPGPSICAASTGQFSVKVSKRTRQTAVGTQPAWNSWPAGEEWSQIVFWLPQDSFEPQLL